MNWTDEERADYQQCVNENADILEQVRDREAAVERGQITFDEYRHWEYEF